MLFPVITSIVSKMKYAWSTKSLVDDIFSPQLLLQEVAKFTQAYICLHLKSVDGNKTHTPKILCLHHFCKVIPGYFYLSCLHVPTRILCLINIVTVALQTTSAETQKSLVMSATTCINDFAAQISCLQLTQMLQLRCNPSVHKPHGPQVISQSTDVSITNKLSRLACKLWEALD